MRSASFLSMLMTGLFLAQPGNAEDAVIRFTSDVAQTTLQGKIQGYEDETFRFSLQAGQKLKVDFQPDNPSAFFNLAETGKEEAMFVGSMSGNLFEGTLANAGEYEVVVYLMRSAAQRDEVANFSLTLAVGEQEAMKAPDVVKKLIAEEVIAANQWTVAQAVNLRAKPQRGAQVLETLAVGTTVSSENCNAGESLSRWCEVSAGGASGWVWGEYLAAAKVEAALPETAPEKTAETAEFTATGQVPCAWERGQPMNLCDFGVVRQGKGNADVWISGPGDRKRYIHFDAGIPTFTDAEEAIEASKEVDLHLIRIGKERFEIPGAAVEGG